jgi:hypothetical protein
MKTLIYYTKLLALVFSVFSFNTKTKAEITPINNILKRKTFRTDGIGFEKLERKTYNLSEIDKEKDRKHFVYGYFIQFNDSTFQSYYRAPCGNDCFTNVQGKYHYLNDSTINVFVDTISKHGKCIMPQDYYKGNFGNYTLSINKSTIKLSK